MSGIEIGYGMRQNATGIVQCAICKLVNFAVL